MTVMNIVKYWIRKFCFHTNLHGYRFIVLPKRVLLESCFLIACFLNEVPDGFGVMTVFTRLLTFIWAAIVFVSSTIAIILLFTSKNQTAENLTLLVTDSINYPIWNYPFPAVTICSFNKISRRKASHQAKLLPIKLNHTDEEIADLFTLLSELYFNNQNISKVHNGKFLQLMQLMDHNELNLNKLLRSLAPSCKSILQKCKWKEEEKSCDMIFEKIITSEGYCCSFNYFAPKNHTFAGLLYAGKSPKKPRRISACGYQASLEVIVDTKPQDYQAADTLAFGNKIFVHNAYDYADWGQVSYLVGVKVLALIGVNPVITYAMKGVKSLAIRERSCYFRDEFYLKNFKYYTYHNCLTECRMNLSFSYCGCIPVIYVNEDAYNVHEHKVCSIRDITCLYKYRQYIRSSVPGSDIESLNKSNNDPDLYPCGCLPDCDFEHYDLQASQGVLSTSYSAMIKSIAFNKKDVDFNYSLVTVFFNDLVGTRNRRSVINNWQTFMAFYGGILGLFVGFSFISGIEFLYFLPVKLVADIWKHYKVSNSSKKRHIAKFLRRQQEIKGNDLKFNKVASKDVFMNVPPSWSVQ